LVEGASAVARATNRRSWTMDTTHSAIRHGLGGGELSLGATVVQVGEQ